MKKLSDIPSIDKPREKLAAHGIQALSNPKLIIVFLGIMTICRGVFTLAKEFWFFTKLSG